MGGISVFRSRSRIRTRWKKIDLGPDPVKERFGPVPLKKIGPGPGPDPNKKKIRPGSGYDQKKIWPGPAKKNWSRSRS